MEAVEHEADGGVIGVAHDAPRIAVVVDVAAPCERFVADAQAAPCGALACFVQVGDGACAVRIGKRRARRADQQQIGAEFFHHIELAFEPVEGAGALRLRQAFQIAERLEHGAGEAKVTHQRRHIARGHVGREQIVLEDLRAVIACGGDGLQFGVKRAADRYGCYRGFHRLTARLPRPTLWPVLTS